MNFLKYFIFRKINRMFRRNTVVPALHKPKTIAHPIWMNLYSFVLDKKMFKIDTLEPYAKMYCVAKVTTGTGYIRLYDWTNRKVFAEITVTNTKKQVLYVDDIPLPDTPSLLRVLAKYEGTGKMLIDSIQINIYNKG